MPFGALAVNLLDDDALWCRPVTRLDVYRSDGGRALSLFMGVGMLHVQRVARE